MIPYAVSDFIYRLYYAFQHEPFHVLVVVLLVVFLLWNIRLERRSRRMKRELDRINARGK